MHIGNFVELKKTQIADGSKANHLTYLGDAVIGKGVNVGAGTITCNYDGVNKSTTTIEDGAFIGSGNMLVAPVRIGKDATTRRGQHHHQGCARRPAHADAREAGDARRLEAAGEKTQMNGALWVELSGELIIARLRGEPTVGIARGMSGAGGAARARSGPRQSALRRARDASAARRRALVAARAR